MAASFDIAHWRLHNQYIAPPRLETPGEVVRWLGAVQGQEYAQALWGVGLRTQYATEADVEQAIADKIIVRTWFMRGTLHFVPGADIQWMVMLIAPRMRRLIDSINRYLKLEVDDATFIKSQAVIAKALEGGKHLIRPELAAALELEDIAAGGVRLSLLLQRAQADGLICYGVRRGRQVTFTLLEEWVPESTAMERDEALAEFTRRYFLSHGPATVQDFVTWSGLTTGDARSGLEAVGSQLAQEVIDGKTYWFAPSVPAVMDIPPTAYLLPDYDELISGYKDRSALLNLSLREKVGPVPDASFSPPLVLDGRIVGNWRRTLKKSAAIIKVNPLAVLNDGETHAVEAAAERYGRFVGLPVTLQI